MRGTPPHHTHTHLNREGLEESWVAFPTSYNEIIKTETMAPGPPADKIGMAAETSLRENQFLHVSISQTLGFSFPLDPCKGHT